MKPTRPVVPPPLLRRGLASIRAVAPSCVVVLAFALALSTPATATLLVDTGPGPNVLGGRELNLGTDTPGAPHPHTQYLAAEFTLASPHTITGVQGWIHVNTPGELTFRIYGDGGEEPDQDPVLFQTTQEVSRTFSDPPTWIGPDSGLTWSLPAGTYWLAFEVYDPVFLGAMPEAAPGFPAAPLANEAFLNSFTTGTSYKANDDLDLGVRIYVPEPSTLTLLAAGLAGTVALRRRRRAAE